ncbi:MAG: fumarate hydratase [Candidatus Lokiarchaeota archaeon]|nr:fumarate hydratase [Candidatus Lokiarchaeota archaeon]
MTIKELEEKQLLKVFYKLISLAATKLPTKVEQQLKSEYKKEKNQLAKSQLEIIMENLKIAQDQTRPICQDTGIISVSITFGKSTRLKLSNFKLKQLFIKAVKMANSKIPLRPNAVDLFEGNTGNNIGDFVPWFNFDYKRKVNYIEISVFLKGGGCSNVSILKMLNPGEGVAGIKKTILKKTIEAGGKGCPPYTIGIGIGGGEDIAMVLAKRALLIPPNSRNKDNRIAQLEKDLILGLNKTGIGIMGLGGGKAVLDVHIIKAARHPASLPLGISFNCWALRYAKARIYNNKIEFISHKEQEDIKL